jgi:hypothetical protein
VAAALKVFRDDLAGEAGKIIPEFKFFEAQ